MQEGGLVEEIFDRMPMGVVVLDREYRLRRWNDTWLDFLSHYNLADPSRAAAGVSYFDVLPEAGGLRPDLDRALAGEPISRQGMELRTGSQTTYWDIVLTPIVEGGAVSGVIEVTIDATERVTSQKLVEEHQAQYRAVFEASTDALFITTPGGVLVEVNPAACAMFGYGRDELLELSPFDLVDAEFHERVQTFFANASIGQAVVPGRARGIRKDGSGIDVEIHATAFQYGGGPHLLSVVRDVSEEERAMALLEARVAERTNELATLLEISRKVSSDIHIDSLLQTIVAELGAVVPYELATVVVRQKDELVVLDASEGAATTGAGVRYPIDLVYDSWEPIARGQTVIVADVQTDQSPAAAALRAAVEFGRGPEAAARARGSWMGVPMRAGEEVVGAITLATRQPGAYNPHHADLVLAVAGQAANALENARLYGQMSQRLVELEALTRLAGNLTLLQPPEVLLRLVAQTAAKTTRAVAAAVVMFDEHSGEIATVAEHGLTPGHLDIIRQAVRAGVAPPTVEAVRDGKPRVVPNARAALMRDLADSPIKDELATAFWDTLCVVPLLFQGERMGALNSYFPGNEPPSADEIAYLTALADQAAVGLRNVQLLGETERRVADASALARIASNLTFDRPGAETLDALAANVAEAAGAVGCTITLLDAETGDLVMSGLHGFPAGYVEAMRDSVADGAPSGARAALKSRAPVQIDDGRTRLLDSPEYARVHPYIARMDWEPIVLVPLVFASRELGSLELYFRKGQAPHDHDLPFLQALADQVAVAAENVMLFTQLGRRIRQVEAVARISSTLTFAHAIEEMLATLAESVVRSSAVVGCSVALFDPVQHSLRLVAGSGLPAGYIEAVNMAWVRSGPANALKALEGRKPVIIDDQPRRLLENEGYAEAHPLLRQATWKTVVVVPAIYHGEGRGVIVVYYPPGLVPGTADMAFLGSIADQAAVAIENSRLFEQGQSLAAVEERQRLARELHDSVSQALYGIGLGARTARNLLDTNPERAREPVDYVLSLAEAGLAEMRALIFELRPESIEQEGLVEAFAKQAASMRARHAIEVEANFSPEPDVPLAIKEALYRIGKEALHNTVKHARATRVRLRLGLDDGRIALEVSDNGGGFDPTGEFPGHLGLKSMRERSERLGGTITITSSPGQGATIQVSIPVPRGSPTGAAEPELGIAG